MFSAPPYLPFVTDFIGEVLSSQRSPRDSTSLPILIYAWKAYPNDHEYEVDPKTIPWPDEMGDIQFFYNPYLDRTESLKAMMKEDYYFRRPIEWILEQVTGQPNVVCL